MVRRPTSVNARSVANPSTRRRRAKCSIGLALRGRSRPLGALHRFVALKLREYLTARRFQCRHLHGTAGSGRCFSRAAASSTLIVDTPDNDQTSSTSSGTSTIPQEAGADLGKARRTNGTATPQFPRHLRRQAAAMVAICHNMDLGDSVEHNDNPQYPEQGPRRACARTSTGYILYAMTYLSGAPPTRFRSKSV
jgi:hypothetical protein